MNIDRKALVGFIVEIEASRERAKGETRHQSDIFKKAKAAHFDTKAMRKVLERRAMKAGEAESLDTLIDNYELAMGALAKALEAVEGGMTRREAAKKFDVPRAALGVVTGEAEAGTKNAIVDPPATPLARKLLGAYDTTPHDPETGEITQTASVNAPGARDVDAGISSLPATPAAIPTGEPNAGTIDGDSGADRGPDKESAGDRGQADSDDRTAVGMGAEPAEEISLQSKPASDNPPSDLREEITPVASVEAGAAAKPEAERVAAPESDDLTIPSFLRRVAA